MTSERFIAAYRYVKVSKMWLGNKATKGRVYAHYVSKVDGKVRLREIKYTMSLSMDFLNEHGDLVLLKKGGKELEINKPKKLAAKIISSKESHAETLKDEIIDKTKFEVLEQVNKLVKNAVKKGWKQC